MKPEENKMSMNCSDFDTISVYDREKLTRPFELEETKNVFFFHGTQ